MQEISGVYRPQKILQDDEGQDLLAKNVLKTAQRNLRLFTISSYLGNNLFIINKAQKAQKFLDNTTFFYYLNYNNYKHEGVCKCSSIPVVYNLSRKGKVLYFI